MYYVDAVKEKILNPDKDDVIVVFIAGRGCAGGVTPLLQEIYNVIENNKLYVPNFHVLCFAEDPPWPLPIVNIAYFFKPDQLTPLFYSEGGGVANRFVKDITKARRMLAGESFVEVFYTDSEQKDIERVEQILLQEEAESEEYENKYPSIFTMVRNVGKEAWKSAKATGKGLPVLTTAQVAMDRYEVCRGCEHFNAQDTRCTQCGCRMKIKVNLTTAECPIGKWDSVE
jgi:hypothetical protein